jgi:hypothetical protein
MTDVVAHPVENRLFPEPPTGGSPSVQTPTFYYADFCQEVGRITVHPGA